MRTRAMASLRRPVPPALPVTTGRRATARAPESCADSVVYSDGVSPPNSSSAGTSPRAASSSTVVVAPVGSDTLVFPLLCLLLDLRDLVRLAAAPSAGGPGPRTP